MHPPRQFSRKVAAALVLPVGVLIAALLYSGVTTPLPDLSAARQLDRPARIDPDYTVIMVPPNIAPLNFRILEEGSDFVVSATSVGGRTLTVRCRDGRCRFPQRGWRQLLEGGRGGNLVFDVYVRGSDGAWSRFKPIANTIASEPIDSTIVYRRLVPNKTWSDIRGIYQRDLESFRESAILTTRDGTIKCFNCHTFCQNDPNRFLLQVRGKYEGMVLVENGRVRRINTKQEPLFRPLAYASWHPDGRHIAATCNRFIGHSPANARDLYFEALEKRGDLVVYDVESNTISTSPDVFGHEAIETHPCWSPDGKSIYYCRAQDRPIVEPKDWDQNDFDLMRVSYDVATDAWGVPETVVAYSQAGLSCSFPRPSPCGRYVLHMLAAKTSYPIHQESSDLYLLDLATREYRKLEAVSSPGPESYPRWSSNGRWFTFLSSRGDRMSALPYLAYFGVDGQAAKAVLVPRENPEDYGTFTDTYNTLEPVKAPVEIGAFRLAQGIQENAQDARFPAPPPVDAYTGPTRRAGSGGY
ncbi:MAG: hypothetical protein ACYC6Y_07320 [Thermoguttaceae bacterium]